MRKLDLTNYTFTAKNQQGINQFVTYQFKDALVNVITHQNLGLNGPEMLEIDPVVIKIEKANLEVILTEDDYKKIITNFRKFRGFGNNDRPFLKRVYNCPEIPDDGKKVIKFSNN
ncbi:hypothetical protein KAX02_05590 [candidate division WOR-3 bacterium]|nr:hypothetical protein [candidate division WOR-3 bacterium]